MLASILFEIIGYTAATLTTIAFLPQLVRIIKTRSTKDVSWGMYFIMLTGVGLWLTYGLLIQAWPIIFANTITIVLVGAILYIKWSVEKKK
ncbi:MAG: SemiSWEET transporter [Bacteroidetes bacterium]|nr:SemiSWEET transporter [Bacteroidota bacterium]